MAKNLILLIRSNNLDVFINILCIATISRSFGFVVFVFFDGENQKPQVTIKELQEKIDQLAEKENKYEQVQKLLKNYSVANTSIDNFRRDLTKFSSGDFFDVTGLRKEETVEVVSHLLSRGARNVKSLCFRKFPPGLFFDSNEPLSQFYWADIASIADDYASYIERREGSHFLHVFIISVLATIAFALFRQYSSIYGDALSRWLSDYGASFTFFIAIGFIFQRLTKMVRSRDRMKDY